MTILSSMHFSFARDPSESKSFHFFHLIFLGGLLLKGFNALLELVSGLVLLLLPLPTLRSIAETLVKPILKVIPEGPWFERLERWSLALTPGSVLFAAWYFLSHAVVKALVVLCLVKGWMWAYPLSIAVFLGFMGFQTWEYLHRHGLMYMILNVMDLFLIVLTINEWHHALRLRKKNTAKVSN